jgi:hypothetical protein
MQYFMALHPPVSSARLTQEAAGTDNSALVNASGFSPVPPCQQARIVS